MSSGKYLQFRPGASSDIYEPPSFEEFAEALRTSCLSSPRPLEMTLLQPWDFGAEYANEVTILVVPTALRVTFPGGYDCPEFEFEGWVFGQASKPWVRGSLRTNDTDAIMECTIYVLEPGQEMGTERTPGIH